MARPFNVDAARSSFELPPLTRQQIRGLILDLDLDAREVIILAVAQLWQREMGEPDRDVLAELDELRARIDALTREQTTPLPFSSARHGMLGAESTEMTRRRP